MNIRLGRNWRNIVCAAAAIVLATLGGCRKGSERTAVDRPATVIESPAAGGASLDSLHLSSPDFHAGGSIPISFSAYGSNQTPHLRWTKGPDSTKSYLLVLEDPDAPGARPFVHWLVANIPAATTEEPGAGRVLSNSEGEAAYYGPHPPSGTHRYVFQVFALDIPEIEATDRDGAVDAMKGHVVAKGKLVATFAKP